MIDILIGIVFIIGGLSGKLVRFGTKSGPALAGVGAGLMLWGVVKLIRARKG